MYTDGKKVIKHKTIIIYNSFLTLSTPCAHNAGGCRFNFQLEKVAPKLVLIV